MGDYGVGSRGFDFGVVVTRSTEDVGVFGGGIEGSSRGLEGGGLEGRPPEGSRTGSLENRLDGGKVWGFDRRLREWCWGGEDGLLQRGAGGG